MNDLTLKAFKAVEVDDNEQNMVEIPKGEVMRTIMGSLGIPMSDAAVERVNNQEQPRIQVLLYDVDGKSVALTPEEAKQFGCKNSQNGIYEATVRKWK